MTEGFLVEQKFYDNKKNIVSETRTMIFIITLVPPNSILFNK